MGTTWSVQVVRPVTSPEVRQPQLALSDAEILAEIEGVLARVVAEMSHWEPGSDLSRFNRSDLGRWQPLPPGFAEVLAAALKVAEASDGAFDPAMGRLVDLWGFGPARPRDGVPSEAALNQALAASGRRHVEQDGLRARRLAPATLDFSGIAKGYAVDAVAERLRGLGLADFLVEIGGELRGEGIKPDGQPWWVDLEPAPGVAAAPIRVALHGLSIATSGDYRRRFRHGAREYAHTLDPRSGRPLENRVASLTVLHPSCMLADAWATALTVLGTEGMAAAEREGLAVHMAVRGSGELLSSRLTGMLG
ncbi:FAD:protein FMN transferase [Sphingomonas sp. S2-65]|uniref:FAD:protein FMN transferase n=1 Tax=Sphingomonas sp. S2-65 TaxID=2903960 RepID=UPI001F2D9B11|nr:FAD:protein FMN transferase [Sphingomonas sp. S2-65]UYY58138.1 FAD:protein FMN transferase [Sphingomonas sp. S2-65]